MAATSTGVKPKKPAVHAHSNKTSKQTSMRATGTWRERHPYGVYGGKIAGGMFAGGFVGRTTAGGAAGAAYAKHGVGSEKWKRGVASAGAWGHLGGRVGGGALAAKVAHRPTPKEVARAKRLRANKSYNRRQRRDSRGRFA